MRAFLIACAVLFCSVASADDKFIITPAFTVKPAVEDKSGCKCGPACDCVGPCDCDASKSVVYISTDLGNGASGGGTGTVIASENGRSLILTNAHVVESDAYPVSVTYWWKGQPYKSKAKYVAGSSVSHLGFSGGVYNIKVNGPDLALIEVPYELPAVEIAESDPKVGEEVFLFGFGDADAYGVTPRQKTGQIAGDPGYIEPAVKTTIRTVNGDSGAAILNCKNQLVGVHWGGAAVPLGTVYNFTATVLRSKRVLFPRIHDHIEAKRAARAAASSFSQSYELVPKAAPKSAPKKDDKIPFSIAPAAPVAGPTICVGGSCQPTVTRGVFRRR